MNTQGLQLDDGHLAVHTFDWISPSVIVFSGRMATDRSSGMCLSRAVPISNNRARPVAVGALPVAAAAARQPASRQDSVLPLAVRARFRFVAGVLDRLVPWWAVHVLMALPAGHDDRW